MGREKLTVRRLERTGKTLQGKIGTPQGIFCPLRTTRKGPFSYKRAATHHPVCGSDIASR